MIDNEEKILRKFLSDKQYSTLIREDMLHLVAMAMRMFKNEPDLVKNISTQHIINSNFDIKAVLNASVSAIYFADNSDYKSYHYEVIRNLTNLNEPTDEDITKLFKELNKDC